MIRNLIVFIIFGSLPSYGQEIIYTDRPVGLTVNQQLPKDLLSTKTVVIIDPGESGKDWKQISEQAHAVFKRTGIDAVLYFLRDNLFSGMDPQQQIAYHLNSREIANLIFVYTERNSTQVWLTRFNSQWDFISQNQAAWYSKDSTVSKALLPLYQTAAGLLDRKNLLILDSPEFYGNYNFDGKKINHAFPLNMKSFKTGLVKIPVEPITSDISEKDRSVFADYQQEVIQDNEELENMMKNIYPFKFETIDYSTSDEELINRRGIQYLLFFIHSNAKNVREMLGFDVDPNAKEFSSNGFLSGKPFTISIPANRIVYKFYVKHLSTGDLYSGTVWDADTSLKDALSNFINNMKIDFKINP